VCSLEKLTKKNQSIPFRKIQEAQLLLLQETPTATFLNITHKLALKPRTNLIKYKSILKIPYHKSHGQLRTWA
jgi:hypothetical protein